MVYINMRNKKYLWLLAPVFLVVLVLLFYKPIISNSIHNSLAAFTKENFDAEFQAKAVYRDGNTLIIENPLVRSDEIAFNSELMLFEFHVKPFSLEVDLHVSLFQPSLKTGLSAKRLKEILQAFAKSSYIPINPKISVREGALRFENLDEPLYIQLLQDQLKASFGDPTFESNTISANMKRSDVKVSVDNLALDKFSKICKVLWPEYDDLSFEKGTISANGNLVLEKSWPRFVGEAKFTQLSFFYKPNQMHGDIGEVILSMQEDSEDKDILTGRFEITEKTDLHFQKDAGKFWDIENLTGGVYFHPHEGAEIAFKGLAEHHGEKRDLTLEGKGHFFDVLDPSMNLNLRMDSLDKPPISAHFAIRSIGNKCHCADIQVSHFGAHEYEFMQRLLVDSDSRWSALKLNKGVINASLLASLKNLRISELNLDKIEATDVEIVDLYQGLAFDVDHLEGELSLDLLAQKGWEKVNANLKILGGELVKNGWVISDIETELKIKEGVVKDSTAKANFAGLKGSVEMDWTAPGPVMKIDFKGGTKELAEILPLRLQHGLKKEFKDDIIQITAIVGNEPQGVIVEGEFKVNSTNAVYFGFELEKNAEAFWGAWPVHEITSHYWDDVGLEITQIVLPAMASPLAFLKNNFLNHEKGIYGFLLRRGWFEAQNIPLAKYLSSFAFQEDQMSLSGIGDIEGRFDHTNLSVKYRAKDVVLSNEDLSIEIGAIQGPAGEFIAEHYFNFPKATHFGTIPVKNGVYVEKNTGLRFSDINAQIILEDKQVHLPEIDAFCTGIYFAGSIDIDYRNPLKGYFDIDVKAHTMDGNISQIQQIFSHFKKPFFFLKLPLEGNLAFRESGGHLGFSFKPGDFDLKADFDGILTEGKIASETFDIAVQDLNLNIQYNHEQNYLNLSDIQGTVLVGDPNHVEEYSLVGDHIRFDDYTHNKGEFDFWVGDKKRDVIRLAGKTTPVSENGETIEFTLNNQISHFGDVHPSIFRLVLKEWSQVENFDLVLNFKLDTLLHDLQRFSRTGLFFLSRNLLKELNDLKTAGGDFSLDFHFDDKLSALEYRLKGEATKIANYQFEKILLNGRKNKETWFIDQLQLDDLAFAAEFLRGETSWIVNFLGVRYGKSLLMGMEGEYKDGTAALETKVNLFELDLSQLTEWPSLRSIAPEGALKGEMRATGDMRFELGKGTEGWVADLSLNSSLKGLELLGLSFGDMENIKCSLNSDRGLTFKNLKSTIKGEIPNKHLAALELDRFDYNLASKSLVIENLHFDAPVEQLIPLTENLKRSFPKAIKQEVGELIMKIKDKGSLAGTLSLELTEPRFIFKLDLPEGKYTFSDQEHEINQFALEYDSRELNILTHYRYEQLPFWLKISSKDPEFSVGDAFLTEKHPSQGNQNPLKIQWMIHPSLGFKINTVEGSLSGLNVKLFQNNTVIQLKGRQQLMGQVSADVGMAARLFSDEISSAIKNWKVGRGYLLDGHWELFSSENDKKSTQLKFQGELRGKDFEFDGYQFQNLVAQVNYTPEVIYINDLNVADPAAVLHTPRIEVKLHEKEHWMLSAESVMINDLRPSRLQETGKSSSKTVKPLIIRQAELQNLIGILGKPDSFKATGQLTFANPKKKNMTHPLFAIPGEIISRIGLDMEVLNPANGTIFYDIREGKIFLSKFKDVYSQGKLSKFYLANNGYQSFVDFQGNLHLQIRMKQYNIIFKLAELFTVTVTGRLGKPEYSLNQPSKKEEVIATEELIDESILLQL